MTEDKYNEIVAFARHMQEEGEFDARDLIAYFEKPWKWEDERAAWLAPNPA